MLSRENNHTERKFNPEDFEGLYHRITEQIDRFQPQMSLFENNPLYSHQELNADLKLVKKMEDNFHRRESPQEQMAKKQAAVLEIVTTDSIDSFGWLGPEVYAFKTTPYDDYVGGVDTVIEYNDPRYTVPKTNYAGFGLDLTYSLNLGRKISRIKEEILAGNLPEVKYGVSGVDGEAKRLEDLPMFVITADPLTILELGQLWADANSSDQNIRRASREALTNHWYKDQLVDFLKGQSRTLREFAHHHNRKEIAEAYDNISHLATSLTQNTKPSKRDNSFIITKNHFDYVFNTTPTKPQP